MAVVYRLVPLCIHLSKFQGVAWALYSEGDSTLLLVEGKNPLQDPEEVVTMSSLTYSSLDTVSVLW